jgi:hypothetical protein
MSRPVPLHEVAAVLARARANAGRTDVPTVPPEEPRELARDPAPNSPQDLGARLPEPEESPLERFERLAEAFRKETGIWPPGKDRPAAMGSDGIPDAERMDLWTDWLRHYRLAAASASRVAETNENAPPSDPPPGPTGQAALPGLEAPAPAQEAAAAHSGPTCKDCHAPIYWAQVLEQDEAGQLVRVKNERTGRFKAMPVNVATSPEGNVVLLRRKGEGIVCRVLKHGEAAPPGARLRTSHFVDCPNAKNRRSPRGRR